MNAPIPPAPDGPIDSLKQPSQFPGGYGQGFSCQSEQTVDQADIPQEALQSGEGNIAFCVLIWNRFCLVWIVTLICLHVLTSVIFAVQLLGGSRPRSRSWLQLQVLRIPLRALDSLASPFTTAGLCPGAAPEIPVA